MLTFSLGLVAALIVLCAVLFVIGTWRLFRTLALTGTFALSGPAPDPLTTTETVICGAALGVFAGFVHSFGLGAPWPALLQAATAITAVYGVNVITGASFRNLFNLPQGVLLLISLVLGGLEIGAPYLGVSSTWAGIIQGAVAFALSLGFGTAVSTAAAKRAHAR